MLRRHIAVCAAVTLGMALAVPAFAGEPYLVKDINPGPAIGQPLGLTAVGNRVFFFADDGIHGRELWLSDGTEAGTHLFRDINVGPDETLEAPVGSFLVDESGLYREWLPDSLTLPLVSMPHSGESRS